MKVKGIILAGGYGTRLFPITQIICKQLLPIFDKPLIHYPLSTLMLSGIKDILLVTTPKDVSRFEGILGDGSQLGINISYATQEVPRGLADAFIIGKKFIGNDSVCLILGDNIFYGHGLTGMLQKAARIDDGAIIFGYYVKDPGRYGVVDFDGDGNAISIVEKPKSPMSNYAIVGLYYYDNTVIDIANNISPSSRGEIEITDVNMEYLKNKKLKVQIMDRGFAWLDTGTFSSMHEASSFVKTIEERQGLKVCCIEEVAYRMGYIDSKQLEKLAEKLMKSGYGEYLINILK